MRHEDGSWVLDTFEGHELNAFGGIGGTTKVERGRPYSRWEAVQGWCRSSSVRRLRIVRGGLEDRPGPRISTAALG